MPEKIEAKRQVLIDAFNKTVTSPNEIDFCSFVKLNSLNRDEPTLTHCSKKNIGREINLKLATQIARAEALKYEVLPFSTLRIEQSDTKILGWLPIWDEKSVEQRKDLYIGAFVLYISSTPVGKDIFNIAIQTSGREHISIAKEFLDSMHNHS